MITLAVTLLALTSAWLTYFVNYGECDFRSKYCIVNIAGTRSEIGVEWDSWSMYVSTYPNG